MTVDDKAIFIAAAGALDRSIKASVRSAIVLRDQDGEFLHYARVRYLSNLPRRMTAGVDLIFDGGRIVHRIMNCDSVVFRNECQSWLLPNPAVPIFGGSVPLHCKSEAHTSVWYSEIRRSQPALKAYPHTLGLQISSSRSGRQIDSRELNLALRQQSLPFTDAQDLLAEIGIDEAVLRSSSAPRIEIEIENPIRFTDQTRFDGNVLHVEVSLPSELRDVRLFGVVKLDQRDGDRPIRTEGELPKPRNSSSSVSWKLPSENSVQATIQVRYGTVILAETVVQHSLNSRNPLLEFHRALFPDLRLIDQLKTFEDSKENAKSRDFEGLVAVVLGLLGLKQLAYRRSSKASHGVDVVAISDANDVYLAEVSLGTPSRAGKAQLFRDRIARFKRSVADRKLDCREVLPIFVTHESKPADHAAHDLETMGAFKIVWREDLVDLIQSLDAGTVYSPDELAARFRVVNDSDILPKL